MATQTEVLQKVNDYCTEKQYTLNDDFRSKFSEKFSTTYADADIEDESVMGNIKFSLDTAFSAASKELKAKAEDWGKKESDYLKQIETLKGNPKVNKPNPNEVKVEIPDEVKEQLAELNKFKAEQQKQEKRAKVLDLAKQKVRSDLHDDLEQVLNIMQLDYDKGEDDLAEMLNANFTKLYKNRIGDTRPITSNTEKIKDEDYLNGVKKVKI